MLTKNSLREIQNSEIEWGNGLRTLRDLASPAALASCKIGDYRTDKVLWSERRRSRVYERRSPFDSEGDGCAPGGESLKEGQREGGDASSSLLRHHPSGGEGMHNVVTSKAKGRP